MKKLQAPASHRARDGWNSKIPELLTAIKQCRNLEQGRRLHLNAVEAGLHTNKFVSSVLIAMYSKCRVMAFAQQVFEETTDRDVVTWNTLIHGYVENGELQLALEVFASIDCEPSSATYVAVLKAIGGLPCRSDSEKEFCLEKVIGIDRQVRDRGCDSNVVVASSLIAVYSRCGRIVHARKIFDKMEKRDVVSWNTLMTGYVENGDCLTALEVFTCMDCEPSTVTFVTAIKACGILASQRRLEKGFCVHKGMSIHRRLQERGGGFDETVSNALVDMYRKCSNLECARTVFDWMLNRNVVSWTSMISGYVANGKPLVAIDLFTNMDCQADAFTYVAALKAFAGMASENSSMKSFCLERAMAVHKHVKEFGMERNVIVANTMVELYGRLGSFHTARKVFDGMENRNVFTWTCLIQGYVGSGEFKQALEAFKAMDCQPSSVTYVAALKACTGLASQTTSEKQSCLDAGLEIHKQLKDWEVACDVVLANALVDMYSKCGSMDQGKFVFDSVHKRDVILWNTLILGYVENGESMFAIDLFTSMDCEPDSLTYLCVLKACGSLPSLPFGRFIHAKVCQLGLKQDLAFSTTLIEFYSKCGSMTNAQELFDGMHSSDIVSWTALIAGYCTAGESSQVFSLIKEMEEGGVEMDSITFTCVLTSCSHAGLVQEAERLFGSMLRSGTRLSVEQYNCMVDVLGRAKQVDEALALVKNMPVEANGVTWTTLLGACVKWENMEISKAAFGGLATV